MLHCPQLPTLVPPHITHLAYAHLGTSTPTPSFMRVQFRLLLARKLAFTISAPLRLPLRSPLQDCVRTGSTRREWRTTFPFDMMREPDAVAALDAVRGWGDSYLGPDASAAPRDRQSKDHIFLGAVDGACAVTAGFVSNHPVAGEPGCGRQGAGPGLPLLE